jgi:hypothetical protein
MKGSQMKLKPVVIDWCSLVPSQSDWVRQSLDDLRDRLSTRYPSLPPVDFREMSGDECDRVEDHLMDLMKRREVPKSDPFHHRRLFVFCSRDAAVARTARKENPMAEWGAARMLHFAIAWKVGSTFTLWHEAMHVLGADDCYDDIGRSTCKEPHCLMQYALNEADCAGELVLCKSAVRLVSFNFGGPLELA